MTSDDFSTAQLLLGLFNEYSRLCDDGIEEDEPTPEEYLEELKGMTREELIAEADRDTPEDWELSLIHI